MKKLLFTLLVVVIGLAPSLAAAQTGYGGTGSSDKSGSSGSSTSPGGSSTTSPSASPSTSGSGSSIDMSQYKTKSDCEKNGGQWQVSTSTCSSKASK